MKDFRNGDIEFLEDILENLPEIQEELKAGYYLRIENDSFGFVIEGIHEITELDKLITNEDYDRFFKLQSQGKQFRLKENATGNTLFDYIEEYVPKVVEGILEAGLEEMVLDHEYRLSKFELGV